MNLEEFRKKDPFRDEHVLYLHIDEQHPGYENVESSNAQPHHQPHHHKVETEHSSPQQAKKKKTPRFEEERTFIGVLKDAGKQILVIAIIFIIGFLAMNWSAYYKIAKNEITKLFGNGAESPLDRFAEDENLPLHEDGEISQNDNGERILRAEQESTIPQSGLTFSPTVEKKKKLAVPDLHIDVAPIDNRIIIPRIDQNIPIVRVSSENLIKRDWAALENDIQGALQDGVVHYPGTSLPGQKGNIVITGHSSYFPWDPGRFKDVFALLHDVVVEDRIVVYYNQKKYIYEVEDIQVVLPDDIRVLEQTESDQLTLITCTPIGTNLKRLIVVAKLIGTDDTSPKVQRAESNGISVDAFDFAS